MKTLCTRLQSIINNTRSRFTLSYISRIILSLCYRLIYICVCVYQRYVSVLDGPGSIRQNELQVQNVLYSQGCDHQLYNDVPTNSQRSKLAKPCSLLSDCEAQHAIAMMKDSVLKKKPFLQQVWFHAPHGPWETIPEFTDIYKDNDRNGALPSCDNPNPRYCLKPGNQVWDRGSFNSRFHKYRTMVSMMDRSIGLLMKAIKDLGIERNTLVIFLR